MARKAISNDRYRLVGTYERLRRTLLTQLDDGRLEKATSYWVLPTDRRLPIAFLDRSLRDLLSCPLDELMATPGVGQKKVLGFFDLLKRASKAASPNAPFGMGPSEPKTPKAPAARRIRRHDRFRSAVDQLVRNGPPLWLGAGEARPSCAVAPSALPTVIWHTRLDDYADRSLARIPPAQNAWRKTRQCRLEIFCTVHEAWPPPRSKMSMW